MFSSLPPGRSPPTAVSEAAGQRGRKLQLGQLPTANRLPCSRANRRSLQRSLATRRACVRDRSATCLTEGTEVFSACLGGATIIACASRGPLSGRALASETAE